MLKIPDCKMLALLASRYLLQYCFRSNQCPDLPLGDGKWSCGCLSLHSDIAPCWLVEDPRDSYWSVCNTSKAPSPQRYTSVRPERIINANVLRTHVWNDKHSLQRLLCYFAVSFSLPKPRIRKPASCRRFEYFTKTLGMTQIVNPWKTGHGQNNVSSWLIWALQEELEDISDRFIQRTIIGAEM